MNKTPSSGIFRSLVEVALPTELTFIILVPDGEVFKKSILPAVPVLVSPTPLSLDLPEKITSAAEAFTPAETLPAGLPTADMPEIVKK